MDLVLRNRDVKEVDNYAKLYVQYTEKFCRGKRYLDLTFIDILNQLLENKLIFNIELAYVVFKVTQHLNDPKNCVGWDISNGRNGVNYKKEICISEMVAGLLRHAIFNSYYLNTLEGQFFLEWTKGATVQPKLEIDKAITYYVLTWNDETFTPVFSRAFVKRATIEEYETNLVFVRENE